jgi:hypothetical protein
MPDSRLLGHEWVEKDLDQKDKDWGEERRRWVCSVCSGRIFYDRNQIPGPERRVMVVRSSTEVELFSCGEYLAWSVSRQ